MTRSAAIALLLGAATAGNAAQVRPGDARIVVHLSEPQFLPQVTETRTRCGRHDARFTMRFGPRGNPHSATMRVDGHIRRLPDDFFGGQLFTGPITRVLLCSRGSVQLEVHSYAQRADGTRRLISQRAWMSWSGKLEMSEFGGDP